MIINTLFGMLFIRKELNVPGCISRRYVSAFCSWFAFFMFSLFGLAAGQINEERNFNPYNPSVLPSPFITDISQDEEGYIWVATRNGLCRFDGEDYRIFQNNPDDSTTINLDHARALLLSKKGDFWVGTFGGGLSLYNKFKETFQTFRINKGVDSDRIHKLAEAPDGKIWCATEGGLHCFDPDKRKFIPSPSALKNPELSQNLRTLWIAPDGKVWVGTNDRGLYLLDPKSNQINQFPDLQTFAIMDIENVENDLMLLGTNKGLVEFDPKSGKIRNQFVQKKDETGPVNNRIFCIQKGESNEFWLGTLDGLSIYNIDNKRFSNYKSRPFDNFSLPDNTILTLAKDRNGLIWVGTWHNGFCSTDSKKRGIYTFQYYDSKAGVQALPNIISLTEDQKENLWLASATEGLYCINMESNQIERYKHDSTNKNTIQYNHLWTVFADKISRLWIGTNSKGISKMDLKTRRIERLELIDSQQIKIPFREASTVYEDKNDKLWFGTFRGLIELDIRTNIFKKTWFMDKLGGTNKTINQILCIAQSKSGKLWIGTNGGGLVVFNPVTGSYEIYFSKSNKANDLKSNTINSIVFDENNTAFLATSGAGIMIAKDENPKKFTALTGNKTKIEKTIVALVKDYNGTIWAAGDYIYKISKPGLTFDIKSTESKFRLPPNRIQVNAGICTKAGKIIFSGSKGILTIDPNVLNFNNIPGPVRLTSFKIFDQELKTDTNISLLKNINLNHDQNYFSIRIANLAYGLNADLCQYKMEGLQDKWLNTKGHETIRFNQVPAGKYTFRVRQMMPEGNQNYETRLSIIVNPPWWQTWWFYTIIFISFLVVSFLFVQNRIKKIKKTEQEKNRQELEKLELELKVLRSQMNPHFMFNALNSIESYIWNNEIKAASEYLGRFARLMRLVLENSHFDTVPIDKELEALMQYLQLEAMRADFSFDFEIKDETGLNLQENEITPMLLQPFVENAILHGLSPLKERKGKIEILIVKVSNQKLQVIIRDNGVGRKISNTERISFGMSLTRERILKLNQNKEDALVITDLKDSAGKPMGTEVTIYLPFNSKG